MNTPQSPPLLTALRCATFAASLLPLAGCWEKVPFTGIVDSAIPAKSTSQSSTSPETQPAAPPISDPFLDEDIFADTSSMFDTTPQPVANDPEVSSPPLVSSDGSAAGEEQVSTQQQTQNTRQLVWKLGCNLSMAASHFAPLSESTPLEESKLAAMELTLLLPELQDDPFADETELSAQEVMETLLPMGRKLGKQLFAEYDREHVALFEVGFKSSMLLVLYAPDSPMNDAMVNAIEIGAAKAKLPPRLWEPLVDAIKEQQPRAAIEKKVFELHKAAFDFLAD